MYIKILFLIILANSKPLPIGIELMLDWIPLRKGRDYLDLRSEQLLREWPYFPHQPLERK